MSLSPPFFVLRLTQFELGCLIASLVESADQIVADMQVLSGTEYAAAAKIGAAMNAIIGRAMEIR